MKACFWVCPVPGQLWGIPQGMLSAARLDQIWKRKVPGYPELQLGKSGEGKTTVLWKPV